MARSKIATVEEMACIDFIASAYELTPSTGEGWAQIGATKLPMLRLAWLLLYKSNAEIEGIVENSGDETFFDISNGVRDVAISSRGPTPLRTPPSRRDC
jgi:hypothetical protein